MGQALYDGILVSFILIIVMDTVMVFLLPGIRRLCTAVAPVRMPGLPPSGPCHPACPYFFFSSSRFLVFSSSFLSLQLTSDIKDTVVWSVRIQKREKENLITC